MTTVVILTEGGPDTGFGHLTRCLSFYQAFTEQGIDARILVNGDSSVRELLSGTDHAITDWIADEEAVLSGMTKDHIVLIDSYLAPLALYRRVSRTAGVAAFIDDERRFSHYPAGVLINGGIHAGSLDYSAGSIEHFLLGPDYQPVRKSFVGRDDKVIREDLRRILITLGGSDAAGLTPAVIRHLDNHWPGIDVDAIVGKAFGNVAEIENAGTARTTLIHQPDEARIAELMLEADIVITAVGQTLFELAAVGAPGIAVSIFRKHRNFAVEWEKAGFIAYAGYAGEENLLSNLDGCLHRLASAVERRKRSVAGRSIVDGRGAARVRDFLLARLAADRR